MYTTVRVSDETLKKLKYRGIEGGDKSYDATINNLLSFPSTETVERVVEKEVIKEIVVNDNDHWNELKVYLKKYRSTSLRLEKVLEKMESLERGEDI